MFNKVAFRIASVFLVLIASSIYAVANPVSGGLSEGEVKSFVINGVAYGVALDFVGSTTARLSHRGELSSSLREGESHDFSDNLRIKLVDVVAWDYSGGVRSAYFTLELFDFCGDNICKAGEACDTCPADCGQCPVICGDGKCGSEDCEVDSCCAGNRVDIKTDYFNCGVCGKKCSGYDVCKNGKCVPVCGNGRCEKGEDYTSCSADCKRPVVCGDSLCDAGETCCKDCGCPSGESCENDACVSLDKCSNDADCGDGDACTTGVCSGIPKKCAYVLNGSCSNSVKEVEEDVVEEEPVEGVSGQVVTGDSESASEKVPGYEKIVISEDAASERQAEETTAQRVPEKTQEKKSFISTVVRWFKSIF